MRNWILILAVIALWFAHDAVRAENPSFEKSRRGQVAYADDQLFFASGTIAIGASATIRLPIEQNFFSVHVVGADCRLDISELPEYQSGDTIQFSPSGPFTAIDMKDGEAMSLNLERPAGSFVRVRNIGGASISYRYVATGRRDDREGTIR